MAMLHRLFWLWASVVRSTDAQSQNTDSVQAGEQQAQNQNVCTQKMLSENMWLHKIPTLILNR